MTHAPTRELNRSQANPPGPPEARRQLVGQAVGLSSALRRVFLPGRKVPGLIRDCRLGVTGGLRGLPRKSARRSSRGWPRSHVQASAAGRFLEEAQVAVVPQDLVRVRSERFPLAAGRPEVSMSNTCPLQWAMKSAWFSLLPLPPDPPARTR